MQKKIITTVGTSFWLNYLKATKKNPNKTLEETPYSKDKWKELYEEDIKPAKERLLKWAKEEGNENVCAEIASLLKIQEEIKEEVVVYLICTETILSRLCAECIQEWFEKRKDEYPSVSFDKTLNVIEGLQVKNRLKFEREGLIGLLNEIERIAQNGEYWNDCALNITGGYKAVIPFLTIVGQVKGVPIYYVFEEVEQDKYELIEMPQVQISIDLTFLFRNSKYFLELEDSIECSFDEYNSKNDLSKDFKKYCIEVKDGNDTLLGLNGLGIFLLKEYQSYYFVQFPFGCPIFMENIDKKKQVESAIQQLKSELESITEPFDTFHSQFIKHVRVDDSWIYKHQSPQQIRIQYKWDSKTKTLIIINYVFILNTADDKGPNSYEPRIKREYPNLKEQIKKNELSVIGFKKI